MNRRLAVVVMLAGFVGAGVAQTAKPNFAGTWKLNLAKSDLGQMAPTSETNTISQTADTVTVATTSDAPTTLKKDVLDGKQAVDSKRSEEHTSELQSQ